MGNFSGYLQWYDYLRLVTAVLLVVALYGSGRHAFRDWRNYTQRLRELWWVFNAALLLLAEGSIESAVMDNPWGPRVLLNFILSLAAIKAVHRNGGYLHSESDTNSA